MDEDGVLPAHLVAHLADRFQEGKAFDVPNGTADFYDRHIHILGDPPDDCFDLVGDVRDDLNRLAEEFPFLLLLNHGLVDLARGGVVFFGQPDVREPLIVAQVQIGFRTVIGYKNLSMLERAHGARIHIDIGIKLEEIDFKPAGLSRQPIEALASPLPNEDRTPPVTKIYFIAHPPS